MLALDGVFPFSASTTTTVHSIHPTFSISCFRASAFFVTSSSLRGFPFFLIARRRKHKRDFYIVVGPLVICVHFSILIFSVIKICHSPTTPPPSIDSIGRTPEELAAIIKSASPPKASLSPLLVPLPYNLC